MISPKFAAFRFLLSHTEGRRVANGIESFPTVTNVMDGYFATKLLISSKSSTRKGRGVYMPQELFCVIGISHGAPSQQFVFIWQCGQSQRVATGSYGLPQKSQGI
jgi:hypothetical protein